MTRDKYGPVSYAGPAIETRYLGPTNYRGARIVAYVTDGSEPALWRATDHRPSLRLTLPYDHVLSRGFEAHEPAAMEVFTLAHSAGFWSWVVRPRFLVTGTERGYRWTVAEDTA